MPSLGSYDEVAWGIVTTFLAFVLGLLWRRLTQFAINHRARRFWRPLVKDQLSVVLGRFRLDDFEPSGVVGAGDNIALKELSDYLNQIGFKRFSVAYHDESGRDSKAAAPSLRGNLILLGGPDANSLTREVLSRTPLGIHFSEVSRSHLQAIRAGRARVEIPLVEPRRKPMRRRAPDWRIPVIVDEGSREVHGPEIDDYGELLTDCGVLIRCPNPFDPGREAIIFCGSYGYGTWAAVRFAISEEFLDLLPKGSHSVECVIGIEIFHDAPRRTTVKVFRPLDLERETGVRPVVTVPEMKRS